MTYNVFGGTLNPTLLLLLLYTAATSDGVVLTDHRDTCCSIKCGLIDVVADEMFLTSSEVPRCFMFSYNGSESRVER